MHSKRSDWAVGFTCAALGAILFSGKAIVVKLSYRYSVDPVVVIALRMGMALPFFILAELWSRRQQSRVVLTRNERWRIVLLGFTGYYLSSLLDFYGLQYITAALERLILYLSPTFVVLITAVLLRRPIGKRVLLALALSYCGVLVAFAHDVRVGRDGLFIGSAFVMASALTYAAYVVMSGELVKRVGALRLTTQASIVACLCCLLHFALTRDVHVLAGLQPQVWQLGLLNAVAFTVLPVFAMMLGISRLGAPRAAMIGMIGPVSTIFMAAVVLDEPITPWQLAGMALVMWGVWMTKPPRVAVPAVAAPVEPGTV
ncbi:DMT family transporter [soil metagenome]